MRYHSLAALSLLIVASGAGASIYKVVGPDGKVSYTDQPLKAAAPNVHVFRAGTARPTDATSSGKPGAGVPANGARDASTAAEGRDSATPQRPEYAPMMPAVRVVLGNSILVREAMQLCMQAQPTSTARFEGAVEGWTARNKESIVRAEEIMASALAPNPRIQLKQGIIDRTRHALRPVREGAADRRVAWCDAITSNIDGGKFDLASDPDVVALLRARR